MFHTLAAAAASTSADTIAIIGTIVIGLGWLAAIVISSLKGKPWFAVLGLFWGIFAWVGAIRLAKPGSWFYRERYDDDKRREAWARFESTPYPGGGDVVPWLTDPAAAWPPMGPQ